MKSTFVALILVSSLIAQAEKPKSKPESVSTKESMSAFLKQIMNLKPFLVSDEEFSNPKNSLTIQTYLSDLAAAVKKTKHDPYLRQENFKFSRHVLENHIVDTERVFRVGNKSYARWMMNSTLGICMSCHTQSAVDNRHFNEFVSVKGFTSDFDKAEFLYTIKDFNAANPIFEKLIVDYKNESLSTENLEKALQRQIGYYTRIQRDLEKGIKQIDKFLKNDKLPDFAKMNLNSWKDQFEKWRKIKIPNAQKEDADKIVAFAEKQMGTGGPKISLPASDPKLVTDLIVSGILFEYLKLNPNSDKTAEILYWLAICDREVNISFFSSFADLYLRECMTRFPEKTIALRCYNEYEQNTILGYTGSAGINVPADVRAELKEMKELVERKGKVEFSKGSP